MRDASRTAIPTAIVPSVTPDSRSPRAIGREFENLLGGGWRLHAAGGAHRAPRRLLALGYTPRHRIALFDRAFYLSDVRQNPDLRFFVAYVVPRSGQPRTIHARLFYKDVSLVWRAASHVIDTDDEQWIGKGDVTVRSEGCDEVTESKEETTDLPFEMQTALETLSAGARRIPYDTAAPGLVLRAGHTHRIRAFADFTAPRRRAQANRRNLVNLGRPIARFARRDDPTSLRFVAGYEPDFRDGIVEASVSTSRLYGGRVRRYRIVSRNRAIQYFFFAGPRHVWIAPPQATTTALSTYGVRTVDVDAPETCFVPGYEYHYLDDSEDPPELVSQIPEGWVGPPSDVDSSRADASAWLDQLPVVRAFRSAVLGERRRSRRPARPAARP